MEKIATFNVNGECTEASGMMSSSAIGYKATGQLIINATDDVFNTGNGSFGISGTLLTLMAPDGSDALNKVPIRDFPLHDEYQLVDGKFSIDLSFDNMDVNVMGTLLQDGTKLENIVVTVNITKWTWKFFIKSLKIVCTGIRISFE